MPKRLALLAAAIALVVVVVVGLSQAGGDDGTTTPTTSRYATPQEASDAVTNPPPALAQLYGRPSELLPGAKRTYEAELEKLRGFPVVVNKWASWCGPCRAEFPTFQQATEELGDRVAFLGLNTADNDDDARTFLEQFPVAYPSVIDPDSKAALGAEMGTFFPTTTFYDADGKRVYLHQGPYDSVEELEADLERYVLTPSR